MRGRELFTVASEPDGSRPGCHGRPAEAAHILIERPGDRSFVLDPHPMTVLRSEHPSRSRADAAMTARKPTGPGAPPAHLAAPSSARLPHVAADGSMPPRGCTYGIAARSIARDR